MLRKWQKGGLLLGQPLLFQDHTDTKQRTIFRTILGEFWDYFQDHVVTILAEFWDHFGTIFGPHWDLFGTFFRTML
jgi:hypothetical protein